MNNNFASIAQRYRAELLRSVIPFWEEHCLDREHGGYFTCLDRYGSVYDTEKFTWMQWRIVYMFACLYRELEPRGQWLEIALNGYDFLVRHGKDADGFYYFSLNRHGIPSTAAYEIYSNCFAAMGCAALYRVTGEPEHRHEAEAAMRAYTRRMNAPKGRWEKGMLGRPARQTLGHYMMLANLGQVLNECLNTAEFADRIDRAASQVAGRFWNSEYGVLFENINPDGSFDLSSCAGRHLTPGHGLEACWFILEHASKTTNRELAAMICPMVRRILEFAWDKKYGGLYYFMDVLGKPHMELQWSMKLWWVHNEAILAALYAYRFTREPEFRDWFERLDQWTWGHFPDPEHGEWYGYLDRRGKPTHLLKGGKWKTFFHLPRCLHVATKLLEDC